MVRKFVSIAPSALLLQRPPVFGSEWWIDNPIEDDLLEANDDIHVDGAGPADADFTLKVYVSGALLKSQQCTVGVDDFWVECVEPPIGGWTNNPSTIPGRVKVYQGHGNGVFLEKVSVDFCASDGQA
ncbi:MAG: hypothetical protein R3C20_14930 [Planctomycetaceae bacterium]